jgi:hypothetical protein
MALLAGLLAYCLFTLGGAFLLSAWLDHRGRPWIIIELDDAPPAAELQESSAPIVDEVDEMGPTPVADEVEAWLRNRG